MQKTILCIALATIFASCNNEKKETPDAVTSAPESKKEAVQLPYTPAYSSSFEIGDAKATATILQGSWKDWETNKLDNMKSWIADTIEVLMSDNSFTKGIDSLSARWKRGRAGYSSVIDSIDAVIPVYSTDKKENWVLVWAREINTKLDGKKDTTAIMETWRINKDGKADRLYQFDRATRKK